MHFEIIGVIILRMSVEPNQGPRGRKEILRGKLGNPTFSQVNDIFKDVSIFNKIDGTEYRGGYYRDMHPQLTAQTDQLNLPIKYSPHYHVEMT